MNYLKDYRFLVFGILFIYSSILFFSEKYLGSYVIIGKYFGINPIPYFFDLNVLLVGLDDLREGINPYLRMFNYPISWGIFSYFPFLNSSNLIIIGFTLALVYIAINFILIGRLNFREGVFYSLIFISPVFILSIERGNSDLLIFIFLAIPILLRWEKLISIFILLTSILKIYPLGGIFSIFGNSRSSIKIRFISVFTNVIFFCGIFFLKLQNYLLVSEKTPRPIDFVSYGLGVIPKLLLKENDLFLWIVVFFSMLVVIRLIIKFKKSILIDNENLSTTYLLGAGIFILTCLIGFNFEYRLIFLIFTFPQTMAWIKKGNVQANYIMIFSIIVFWKSFMTLGLNFVFGEYIALLFHLFTQILIIFLFSFHSLNIWNFFNSQIKDLKKDFKQEKIL
jgi:hypothetical protein